MAAPARIDITDQENIQIVRFRDRLLTDDPTVRAVCDQIFAALPTQRRPIYLILDFSGVAQVASSLLGKLILLQRRIDSSGGKLRLCELGETVQGVFRTTNLDRLFAIDRDRREAMEAFESSSF